MARCLRTPAWVAMASRPTRTSIPPSRCPSCAASIAEYIVQALQEYAKGERSHATMHAHASSLSEQDMQDIAAYLSGERGEVERQGQPVGTVPAAVAICQACHGRDGVGIADIYPTLVRPACRLHRACAGELSLRRAQERGHGAAVASQLKPEEIKEVAEYLLAAEACAEDGAAQGEADRSEIGGNSADRTRTPRPARRLHLGARRDAAGTPRLRRGRHRHCSSCESRGPRPSPPDTRLHRRARAPAPSSVRIRWRARADRSGPARSAAAC